MIDARVMAEQLIEAEGSRTPIAPFTHAYPLFCESVPTITLKLFMSFGDPLGNAIAPAEGEYAHAGYPAPSS